MNRVVISSITHEKYNVYNRYCVENLPEFIYIIIGMLYSLDEIIYLWHS
jgi:hypothetical protein